MTDVLKIIKQRFEDSFDVKYREINTDLGKCTLAFIDDLCNTVFISEYIVTPLIEKSYKGKEISYISTNVLDINLVNYAKDLEDAIYHVLSGDVILIFEDYKEIIYCEVKGFVRRSVSIPLTESVIKGPREGFTESVVDNVSLIRRKIKNSDLKFEPFFIGNDSKTVVSISYIKGVAPKEIGRAHV